MVLLDNNEWIEVRKTNLKYYNDIDLYYRSPAGEILLYKQAGLTYDKSYQDKYPYKGKLYITPEDKLKSLDIIQKEFSRNLTTNLKRKKTSEVKRELVSIVGETLSQPRSGSLRVVPNTVNAIVESYSDQPHIVKNLAIMSHIDYSTTIHSINVMALMINYCFYTRMPEQVTRDYGLAALLHDVGKADDSFPDSILRENRKLTDKEFEIVKTHPKLGADILKEYGKELKVAIPGALEHHEKLDGSGYPEGRTDISECGKILGIIDCYEAITNDERPYRSAMLPIKALTLLKDEVDKGHFDKDIFKSFAYSLVDKDAAKLHD
ncbi:HD-GYP domain-containing protein [Spirochaeta isovalerica]|uniref:Putative nucleotidyltransferase with HDIG domain n=1 Tax=Spirochaeta isovalerica TaxID=150 RepID=A0A841RCH0_9SPIO|nr:HD domain-containing phosphohydrolase [Spirochaeta isovalerica]MBB6480569.1 putative nucleotidyltransferase with HDIG domain [Spirochaeta isovalerica]